MTEDLIVFLRARLDEREAKARAAGEIGTPDWHVGDDGSGDPESAPCVIDGNGEIVVYDEGRPRLAEAVHIADNDPAGALRSVEWKRELLDEFEGAAETRQNYLNIDPASPEARSASGMYYGLRHAVKLLGSEWASHTDYPKE